VHTGNMLAGCPILPAFAGGWERGRSAARLTLCAVAGRGRERSRRELGKGAMIREDGSIQEFCVWDRVAIPEHRRRKQAVTCSQECARKRRKHYLLERKERYRKAAGLPRKGVRPGGEKKMRVRGWEPCSRGARKCKAE